MLNLFAHVFLLPRFTDVGCCVGCYYGWSLLLWLVIVIMVGCYLWLVIVIMIGHCYYGWSLLLLLQFVVIMVGH